MNLQDALHDECETEEDLYQEENNHILRELWDSEHHGLLRHAEGSL